MRKLVSESVEEFKGHQAMNEGFFSRIKDMAAGAWSKAKDYLSRIFAVGAVPPILVGVMDKENLFKNNEVVNYVASAADIEIEGSLSGLNAERLLNIVTQREKVNVSESFVNEDAVPLEAPKGMKMTNVDKEELMDSLEQLIEVPGQTPLLIWGAPGIGKTQIVKAILKSYEGKRLIDVQTAKMAPDDWALPALVKDTLAEQMWEAEKLAIAQSHGVSWKEFEASPDNPKFATMKKEVGTKYNPSTFIKPADLPKSWLPCYLPSENAEENERRNQVANGPGNEGGIMFFDEISRASGSVQDTCLKLIDERQIGEYKLGDKWVIISAANRQIDDPDSEITMGTALINRFNNINYVPDYDSWKEWAIDKVDSRILDFLDFNREYFYTLDDDEISLFASPRSWAAASKAMTAYLQRMDKKGQRPSGKTIKKWIAGNVGEDIAIEFQTFLRILESFRKEDIKKITENPTKAPLPKKAGSGYDQAQANAILSLVGSSTRDHRLTPEQMENFVTYLGRLENPSLATRGIKMMFEIHPYMHEEIGEGDTPDTYKKAWDMFEEKYGEAF